MPMIKDLFPDNLLATTKLNPSTIPGLTDGGQSGPTFFSGVDLQTVAESIDTTGNATEKADQARPTVLANVSSFTASVNHYMMLASDQMTATEIARPGYKDYLEWQGLAAALALRNVYSVKGLELSVRIQTLNANNPVEACILHSLAKDEYFKHTVVYNAFGQPVSGQLFYLCQKGTAFALFHPMIGICPKKEYDRSIFEGILDWYDPKNGWKNLLDLNTPQSFVLEDFYRKRLAWWLKENGMTAAYNKCVSSIPGYNHDFYNTLAGEALVGAAAIDAIPGQAADPKKAVAIWGGKGTTVLTAVVAYSYQNKNYPLPPLYTDKLFLAAVSAEEAPSRLIYNASDGALIQEKPLGFVSNGGYSNLNGFCPVAPFTPFGADILAQQCSLLDLSFVPEATNDALIAVRVEAQISTPNGETVTIKRRYSCDEIVQGSLPYLMVWPCIPMPQDAWKQYYATWSMPTYSFANLLYQKDGSPVGLNNANLLRIEMNAGQSNTVNRATATGENRWTVWYNNRPFDYAVLSRLKQEGGTETETLGVVFVPYCRPVQMGDPDVTVIANPIVLAVDFGTTSTVVGIKVNGGKEEPLKYCDYSRTLTVEDHEAKKAVMQHRWLGKDTVHDSKIFSVAQLFDRVDGTTGPDQNVLSAAGQNRYYVDGRMFVVSSALLQAYTNGRSGGNVFGAQKIVNDMKFSAMVNPVNMHAAAIFLAGIYQYAILYLLDHKYLPAGGMKYIQLYASYPNDVTLSSLRQSWSYAKDILRDTLDETYLSPLEQNQINYRTEAAATTAYNSKPGIAQGFPHMISVDIGGGTTDIAVKNMRMMLLGVPTESRQLSFRYAGRNLMVESIVECYRRFAGEDTADSIKTAKYNAFNNLWQDPEVTQLVRQFHAICEGSSSTDTPRQALVQNDTLRMAVECLLAGGMDIGDPSLKPEHKTLRQIITLKFGMLMITVAEVIARNMDVWKDQTGQIFAPGDVLTLDMVVSGTSAQLLQYVFNCDLTQLNNMSALNASLPQVKYGITVINQFIENAIGKNVLGKKRVSFKFHVNANVMQKQEVCYGLLEMAGAGGAAPAGITPSEKPAAVVSDAGGIGQDLFGDGNLFDEPESDQDNSGISVVNPLEEQAKRAARQEDAQRAIMNTDYNELMEFIRKKLAVFVRTFDQYVAHYTQESDVAVLKKNGAAVLDLPMVLCDITPEEFVEVQMSTAKRHAAFMAEKEQVPYLKTLARMYLVNELVNCQFSKYQQ